MTNDDNPYGDLGIVNEDGTIDDEGDSETNTPDEDQEDTTKAESERTADTSGTGGSAESESEIEREPEPESSAQVAERESASDESGKSREPAKAESPTEHVTEAQDDSTASSAVAGNRDGELVEVSPDRMAPLAERLQAEPIPGGDGLYALRRELVTDERLSQTRLVLRKGTKEMEQEVATEIDDELFPNSGLSIADIREATYIVGLRHPTEIVEVLNEWGFGEQQAMRRNRPENR